MWNWMLESGKTKKLERSRTLPIIHITKPANENESSTVTPRMQSVSKRKQSVPTITIQRSSDTPSIDDRYTNLQPGDRSGLLRSQSYDRCLVACSSQRISGSAWNFEDDTDSTASSENMTSCSDDVSMHRSPTQLYYTTPPKANMVRNQDERR
ncbi:hypothetical protein ACJMK2_035190 [Sinanodonta woodiana]|uniref:Uncharacterized protein n=1 Tax=Sinanodonta woodiana TaxID=1069815 RepID=A0ABD3WU31_SINWO